MEALYSPETWIALATLTALELVLGIDNIIFITILAGRLPPEQRDRARRLGFRLAHDDEQVQSGPFDSHPLGAERLAVVDRAIAAARASGGRLPPRVDRPLAGLVR